MVERAGIRLHEHDPRVEIYDHAWEPYNRPSMQQHIEGCRQTEIDALNGALLEKAHSLGMMTPVNEAVVALVKAIVRQRRLRATTPHVDEAELEASAQANPRNGRWGTC